jgi:hypothetical protein
MRRVFRTAHASSILFTLGGSPRATEFVRVSYKNTRTMRSLFIQRDIVGLETLYHKSKMNVLSSENTQSKNSPRFLAFCSP